MDKNRIRRTYFSVGGSLLMAFLPALSACGVFTDNSNKYVVNGSGVEVTKGKATTSESSGQVLTPPKSDKAVAAKPSKPSKSKAVKNKNKGKSEQSTSKTARPTDTRRDAVGEAKSPSVQPVKSGHTDGLESKQSLTDFSIEGEWTIYSVRGNIVTGEERPYVCFDLPANRMYGSNGCNIINADISVKAPSSISIENMVSTMKACADAPFEYLINLALADVKSYSARQEGPDTYLDLKAQNGSTLITLRRHNMEFLNGPWAITSLNSTAMPAEGSEDAATIVVDIPQLRIHGNTGCNIFNGNLFIDPDKERSMQFTDIITTRMACAPDSRETELLLALEAVESARQTGADTVGLYDVEGNEIITLKRMVMKED